MKETEAQGTKMCMCCSFLIKKFAMTVKEQWNNESYYSDKQRLYLLI